MGSPNAEKPATAETVNGLQGNDHAGELINSLANNSSPKTQATARCEQCGHELRLRNHNRGRPRRFCSEKCKKAWGRISGQKISKRPDGTGEPFSGLQVIDLKGDFCPEIEISKKIPLHFKQVNEVTFKLTDGECVRMPGSHGKLAGYRTTRALAWVIEISPGRWISRFENTRSHVMTLAKAKDYAAAMASRSVRGKVIADPVGELNALRSAIESSRDWHPAKVSRATWRTIVRAEIWACTP